MNRGLRSQLRFSHLRVACLRQPKDNIFLRGLHRSSVQSGDHRDAHFLTENHQKVNRPSHLGHKPTRSDIFRAICPIAGIRDKSPLSPILFTLRSGSPLRICMELGKTSNTDSDTTSPPGRFGRCTPGTSHLLGSLSIGSTCMGCIPGKG